jgi:cytochrome c553
MTMRFLALLALAPLLLPAAAGADAALDERIALCASCHGEDGKPIEPDYPIIWGQHYYYLYTQLKDYKSGLRANEIMQGIVADLTRDDMKALAQYFSEKPWPRLEVASPSEDDERRAASMASSAECSACHLGSFVGNSRVPRVSSQQPAYLARTFTEYKNKIRNNAPDKGSLFRTFDDADMAAMARYLAAIQPPPSAGGG